MIEQIPESGKQYNNLIVLGKDVEKSRESGRTSWAVRCSCGEEFSALATNVKRGNTTKCKLCRGGYIVGEKFGELTVEKRVVINGKVMWECRCSCGNLTKPIRKDSLVSGHTRSCGCLQRKHAQTLNSKNLVGKKFGRWTVVEKIDRRDSSGNSYYLCNCDCGNNAIEVSGKNLLLGRTLSCGCLKSKGEEKVNNILQDCGLSFAREYRLPTVLSTGGVPRLDFALFDNEKKLVCGIEYQGEQHYSTRPTGIFTEDQLNIIRIRDEEKLQFCNVNNIPIIYISYMDYDILDKEYIIKKLNNYLDKIEVL